MAAFSSEYVGKGPKGKDLLADHDLMEVNERTAKVFRLFMMQTDIDNPVWLRDMQGVVMEELGFLTAASARRYRVMLQRDYGLISNDKEDGGVKWQVTLTDRGVDFVNWLIQDPDGQKWGLKSDVDLSAEEKRRYEENFIRGSEREASEGGGGGLVEIEKGIVKWRLGEWGLLLDDRVPRGVWGKIMAAVHKRGMRTVFVPDGYEVAVIEMTDRGKKAHRVLRWSEFPIVDRQLIMNAEEPGGSMGAGEEENVD